jgi:hypothetical protein
MSSRPLRRLSGTGLNRSPESRLKRGSMDRLARVLGAGIISMLLASPLHAAHPETGTGESAITFNGFGTLGLARTNTDLAEFIRDNQISGARRSPNFGVDSNLGLQLTARLDDQVSLTGQVLTRKTVSDRFEPELTLAFLRAKMWDALDMRAGRIGVLISMVADHRNVGYAVPWVRPPIEVYTALPFEYLDGIDLGYVFPVGEAAVTAQAIAGSVSNKISGGKAAYDNKATNIRGGSLTYENGPVSLRISRARANVWMTGSPFLVSLIDALSQNGFNELSERFRINGKPVNFSGLGAKFDSRDMKFIAEYVKIRSDSATITGTDSWYATYAHKLGRWTPFVTYAQSRVRSPRSDSTVPPTGELAPLAGGVNGLLAGREQSSTSVGIRYELTQSSAFKVQFDRVVPKDGSGFFAVDEHGTRLGPVNVISMTLDFVF